jgi:hypothetical protein
MTNKDIMTAQYRNGRFIGTSFTPHFRNLPSDTQSRILRDLMQNIRETYDDLEVPPKERKVRKTFFGLKYKI